jgi:hypothetical protein
VLLIALLPALSMARKIHAATQMNYQDYWDAMLRITGPDGGLKVRGLFTYQNEHPFFVPQVVYYLDAKIGDGSNHDLGYFSVLMALASLGVIWSLLPRVWSPMARSLVLLMASAFVLCPTGAWNFLKGMSGVAWLTANVFALVAILLARRGRTVPATVLSGLAITTYGTGFAAPVAVIVIALLRRDRRRQWVIPGAVLLVALLIYKATNNGGPTSTGGIGHDPGLLLRTFLTNLSTLWDPTGSSFGLLAGAAALAALALCFVSYWPRRDELPDLIAWWGVATYALGASALISIGRSQLFQGDGAQARYVSLSALLWVAIAVVALRTVTTRRELAVRVAAIAVTGLVFWGASPSLLQTAVDQTPGQNMLAAAVRFNATDTVQGIMASPPDQVQRLRALHDYPFVSSYTVGCGLKPDDSIDMSKVQYLPSNLFPAFGVLDTDAVIGATHQASGWIYRMGLPTRCVLFVDPAGKIVGGGSADTIRSDVLVNNPTFPDGIGFQAVTPASQPSVTLVLGFADGFYKLPAAASPARSAGK